MGLMLQEEEVLARLEEFGLRNANTAETMVYAQVMPNMGAYFLWGAYAQIVKGQYFVMCLDEDRVILLPLGKISGKIDKNLDPIVVPMAELDEIQVKRGRMMHTVKLKGDEMELPLKLSAIAMGLPWHKRNLDRVMKQLQVFG